MFCLGLGGPVGERALAGLPDPGTRSGHGNIRRGAQRELVRSLEPSVSRPLVPARSLIVGGVGIWRNVLSVNNQHASVVRHLQAHENEGDTYPKIDRKLSRIGRKFSGRRRWQSSLSAPSTMWRAREGTFERRRKRAGWGGAAPLSCSIGEGRGLPGENRASRVSPGEPPPSAVRKTVA